MPTAGEVSAEENLHVLGENRLAVVILALAVSLASEESARPSILLCHLFPRPFQASVHSSNRLLGLHDPRLSAHCAPSPASPPSRAPSPSSSSHSPPPPEPLSLRAPAAQSHLSSSAPPPPSPAAIFSCDPPASPPSFSPDGPSFLPQPELDAPGPSFQTRSAAPSAGWSSTCPYPPSS